MARRGRPTVEISLSREERATVERWARRQKSSQALALPCRIVLGCADGLTQAEIAARLGSNPVTVGTWRHRFAADRRGGLRDAPRQLRRLRQVATPRRALQPGAAVR
jgi:hypothetical protein